MPGEHAPVPLREPLAEWSVLGEDTVVLDPSGQRLRGLNATGAWLWARLDGSRDVHALAAQLAAHFDVPAERALADLHRFLTVLRSHGLCREGATSGVVAAEAERGAKRPYQAPAVSWDEPFVALAKQSGGFIPGCPKPGRPNCP